MDNYDGLMRAIMVNPEDDLPRLVLADWLDENAGTVKCKACGGQGRQYVFPEHDAPTADCPNCSGSGTVPDGRRERAEFIRVQCELAKLESEKHGHVTGMRGYCNGCHRVDVLRRRELELFTFHNIEKWFRKPEATFDRHTTDRAEFDRLSRETAPTMGISVALVRRGFIAEVTCSAEAWLGGECRRCDGMGLINVADRCPAKCNRGRTPGLAESLYWRPGATIVCPECGGHSYVRGAACPTCSPPGFTGIGRVHRPMPPTAQPIKRVNLTAGLTDGGQLRRLLDAAYANGWESGVGNSWPGGTALTSVFAAAFPPILFAMSGGRP